MVCKRQACLKISLKRPLCKINDCFKTNKMKNCHKSCFTVAFYRG